MKLQTLLIAIAVAAGGSAFAASDTAKTDGTTQAATTTTTTTTTQQKVTKAKKTKRKPVRHARAPANKMGAAASPQTDLNSPDRQSRIDEAYSKWRSTNS